MSSFSTSVGLRYAFTRQRSGFSSFVAIASMLGMVLGVASLITVLSVMNGFGGELRERILALVPHAYLEWLGDEELPVEDVSRQLSDFEQVIATAPFHSDTVLVVGPYTQQGALVTGIDPLAQQRVSELGNKVSFGALEDIQATNTIILGAALARSIGAIAGDEVRLILPRVTTTPFGAFPRSKRLKLVGVFEVGAQQDATQGYVSRATATRLFGSGGKKGMQLRLRDLWEAPGLKAGVMEQFGESARYRPWNASQGSLFRAIKMEKITVTVLLLGVVFVAAFNIVATLVMAVTERRGDIAVLRTMGASRGEISRIFVLQGLALATLGISFGVAIGCFLALNVASLVEFFEQLLGTKLFDPSVYYISRLPSRLQWEDVVTVVALALLLSLLAVLYPARRASRVPPAEVLRYE